MAGWAVGSITARGGGCVQGTTEQGAARRSQHAHLRMLPRLAAARGAAGGCRLKARLKAAGRAIHNEECCVSLRAQVQAEGWAGAGGWRAASRGYHRRTPSNNTQHNQTAGPHLRRPSDHVWNKVAVAGRVQQRDIAPGRLKPASGEGRCGRQTGAGSSDRVQRCMPAQLEG